MKSALVLSLALSLVLAFLIPVTVLAGDDDPAPHYSAGVKAQAARKFIEAVEHFDKVLEIDEEYKDAFDRWDACQGLMAWEEELTGEPKAIDLVRLGEAYLELEDRDGERTCYEDAIAMDPKCQEAHGHLALWHYPDNPEGFGPVYRETLAYLETSPYAAELADAIADFRVYAGLKNLKELVGEDGLAARRAAGKKDLAKAIELYRKEAGREDAEPAARIYCLLEAGKLASRAKDMDAARKAFSEVVALPSCRQRMMAFIYLAMIETREGNAAKAVEHLQGAVAEGSQACGMIAAQKGKAFKALFTAEDEAVRTAVEALTDVVAAEAKVVKAIADAQARAAKEEKKVILFWYGPYCPYVMALRERLAHPEVKALIEKHFILVTVDQGTPHRLMHLDAEYGEVMECYGVPCFLVLRGEDASPEVRTDTGLMGTENRSYSVELIVDWLKESAAAE